MIEDGLPLRDRLLGDQCLEVGEQRGQIGTGVDASLDFGGDALVTAVGRPVAVVRNVHRDGSESAGHETVGAVQDGGGGLVLAATVADEDQRARAVGVVVRRPQNNGNAIDGEELFAGDRAT